MGAKTMPIDSKTLALIIYTLSSADCPRIWEDVLDEVVPRGIVVEDTIFTNPDHPVFWSTSKYDWTGDFLSFGIDNPFSLTLEDFYQNLNDEECYVVEDESDRLRGEIEIVSIRINPEKTYYERRVTYTIRTLRPNSEKFIMGD